MERFMVILLVFALGAGLAGRTASATACELEPVYFRPGTLDLSEEARAALARNAACIKERGLAVSAEGHSDPRGTSEYNLMVGERRAQKCRKVLQELGVTVEVRVVSYGEERPACRERSQACRQRNRRVEFHWSAE